MHKLALVLLLACTSGCAMTPTQKKIAAIAASVLITGAIIERSDGHAGTSPADVPTPGTSCEANPESCR